MLTGITLLFLALAAAAQDKQRDELIANMLEAFGGGRLLNLRSYLYDVEVREYLFHGGRRPEQTDAGSYKVVLAYDGHRDSYSLEEQFSGGGEPGHTLNLFDAGKSTSFDFRAKDYRVEADPDIDGLIGIFITRDPTLLLRRIANRPENAEIIGEEEFRGRLHTLIRYQPVHGSPIVVFVDNQTYRITKTERVSGVHQVGIVTYFFADYVRQDGILIAKNYSSKAYRRIYQHTVDKKVRFNIPVDRFFETPAGHRHVNVDDLSGISSRKITDDVVHAGAGRQYTVFVDLGDAVASYGGFLGLRDRFEEFQRVTGSEAPLAYHIVSHHHSDHLWGFNEFADRNVRFVAAPDHVETIRTVYEGHLDDNRFIPVEDQLDFGPNKQLEIYDISTRHSEHFLVVYIPASKSLLLADHLFVDGRSEGFGASYASMRSFAAALDELDLDVERFVTVHNARIFTPADLRTALAKEDPGSCVGGRPVCGESR